jgi:hypothetical protein
LDVRRDGELLHCPFGEVVTGCSGITDGSNGMCATHCPHTVQGSVILCKMPVEIGAPCDLVDSNRAHWPGMGGGHYAPCPEGYVTCGGCGSVQSPGCMGNAAHNAIRALRTGMGPKPGPGVTFLPSRPQSPTHHDIFLTCASKQGAIPGGP